MKISLQSQLVALIGLLVGLSIFSVLGFRYVAQQELQRQVNALSQASSEVNHVKTMQEQWLTTLDLFLNDRQSYLAQGINNQTKQLNTKYDEIAEYAQIAESTGPINSLLTAINKGVQELAYAKTQDEVKWNAFITLSDNLTEQLLDSADSLSETINQIYDVKALELESAQSQLVTMALVLLIVYLVTCILVGWWNSHTLVKPLEQLSHQARDGVAADSDDDPKLTIDKGPTEIRELSLSLQKYSTNLRRQQRKTQKAHKEEQQTRQRLSAVMDTAPSAILSTDDKLKILTLNPATEKIFGLLTESLLNKSLSELIPKLSEADTNLAELTDFQAETTQNSATLPIEISSAGLSQNGATQYLFMIKDISRRKAQESKMKSLNEQLVQSEKLASIGQLSAGVAHEINNPVGFVKSNMEVMADYFNSILEYINAFDEYVDNNNEVDAPQRLSKLNDLKDSLDIEFLIEDSQEIFESSKDGLERVCKIVEEMKAFSHVEKDEQQAEDFSNLIDQAISLTANEVKYKADVKTDYSELPPIKCWRTKLLQVLINLLVNASHAMEERGFIRIKTYQKGDFVKIEVLDNGNGISEENQKKIFAPFFTTKPVGQGTGLGLHVSQSIMAKHGGEITVKSNVGAGTCFTLSLPIDGVINEYED